MQSATIRAQPLVNKVSIQRASPSKRATVKVFAQSQDDAMASRRSAIALAAVALIIGSSEAAQAVTAAKNSSDTNRIIASAVASKDGYVMEGTKKMGIDTKRKAKLLAKVRAAAGKAE